MEDHFTRYHQITSTEELNAIANGGVKMKKEIDNLGSEIDNEVEKVSKEWEVPKVAVWAFGVLVVYIVLKALGIC